MNKPYFLIDWRHKRLKNTIDLLLFYGEHFYGFSESEVFSCEIITISKNIYFEEHLRTTAFEENQIVSGIFRG